jgi:hypothetical protein
LRSAFAGFRFPAEVIVVAVRWYLRYNLMGHYELAVDAPPTTRVAAAFTELAEAI